MDPKAHDHSGGLEGRHFHPTPLEAVNGPLPDLRMADIVLIRHKHVVLRYFLRKMTNSYWDHAALIIFARNTTKGYASNVIAEAVQHGTWAIERRGVELHKLEQYLNHPDKYDIGIKRFSQLDDETRDRVRAFMLMNVDAPYYRLPFADFFFATISKWVRKQVLKRQRFSCSGLVQKAYYNAMDWNRRHEVEFRELGDSPIELQELVTPADIANSDKVEWIWNKR
jgi:hypothetical protein